VIPTLEEMVARYPHVPFLIEVKVPEAVTATRRVLENAGAVARSLVDSTIHAAVAPFRGGRLATGASLDDVLRLLMASFLGRAPRALPYEALCIPRWYNGIPVPVPLLARAAGRAGAVTHVWTINSPRVAQSLWQAGVHGIITDDPGPMLDLRRQIAVHSPPRPVPNPPPQPASR
jgi:glycerophosphoryl diester phosphodiesterase